MSQNDPSRLRAAAVAEVDCQSGAHLASTLCMRTSRVRTDSTAQFPTVDLSSSFLSVLQLVGRPTAFLAGVLGLWRFGVDLEWTNEFFIRAGFLSHYQMWFAVAFALPI